MVRKGHQPEEIVGKLRQVDVLVAQAKPVADAIRTIGVMEVTYCFRNQECGRLKPDQVKRLEELEQENTRLRRAICDLTLDKLILTVTAKGNDQAPRAGVLLSDMSGASSKCRGVVRVWRPVSTA